MNKSLENGVAEWVLIYVVDRGNLRLFVINCRQNKRRSNWRKTAMLDKYAHFIAFVSWHLIFWVNRALIMQFELMFTFTFIVIMLCCLYHFCFVWFGCARVRIEWRKKTTHDSKAFGFYRDNRKWLGRSNRFQNRLLWLLGNRSTRASYHKCIYVHKLQLLKKSRVAFVTNTRCLCSTAIIKSVQTIATENHYIYFS